MRLADLDPGWVDAGGEGVTRDGAPVPSRRGVGVTFRCPCGCDSPCYIPFENPLDGGPALDPGHPRWVRTGETFEGLDLKPSILRHGCGWHGFVRNGEVVAA